MDTNLSLVVINTPDSCKKCPLSEYGEYCRLLGGKVQEFQSGTRRNYDYIFNNNTKKYQSCPLAPVKIVER